MSMSDTKLTVDDFHFNLGDNTLVLRGVEASLTIRIGDRIEVTDQTGSRATTIRVTNIGVKRFADLSAGDRQRHHLRSRSLNLLRYMQNKHPGFEETEIVTCITFEVERDAE